MKDRIVIATIKSWNIFNAEKLKSILKRYYRVFIITDKNDLTYKRLRQLEPKYVFFPHWSWIIPKEIYSVFECVVFHMTDLPFGRGGSPLQNLIVRGIDMTKISAIRVDDGIDTGPVYLKKELKLNGKASDIFNRASNIIFNKMIPYILENEPLPVPQKGNVVNFKRRAPSESDISSLRSYEEAYDYIRMLDAEGYPPAFIDIGKLRIEFNNAKLKDKYVVANARIIKK